MNKETKIRGIIAIIFTALSAIATVIFVISCLIHGSNFFESLLSGLVLCFIVGGFIPGITHLGKTMEKVKQMVFLPVVGWAMAIITVVAVPYFSGWFHMLRDLRNYLKARKEV